MKSSSSVLRFVAIAAASFFVVPACGSNTGGSAGSSGASAACQTAPKLEKNAYCSSCTFSSTAQPAKCTAPRTVDACCAWVTPPSDELVRSTGLHQYAGQDATIKLSCLDDPGTPGTPQTVTLQGVVRLFSSGSDSTGVKIEIFKENDDGSLGEAIGTPVVTTSDDKDKVVEDWLKKCPEGGCTFRAYSYPNVPTETRLIIKTSDATGGSQWAELYDYNNYFKNSDVQGGIVKHDPSVVAATDLNTVASAAGGFSPAPDKGLLAGEVHDCENVRLAGATVDIDAAHESDMFYFGDNEADPLPDKNRTTQGTSKLGLFGTLNVTVGVPIRISAVGKYNGQTVLLGTHTVQAFKGAVTALQFRGRAPWQK